MQPFSYLEDEWYKYCSARKQFMFWIFSKNTNLPFPICTTSLARKFDTAPSNISTWRRKLVIWGWLLEVDSDFKKGRKSKTYEFAGPLLDHFKGGYGLVEKVILVWPGKTYQKYRVELTQIPLDYEYNSPTFKGKTIEGNEAVPVDEIFKNNKTPHNSVEEYTDSIVRRVNDED